MANNGKNTGNSVAKAETGAISTIRDILMGQHIHSYDAKFEQMQEELNQLRAQLAEKIEEVDQFHKMNTLDLSKETNQRLNKLEKQLSKQVESLDHKIRTSSAVDKKEMGKLMANIGKKLIGE